MSQLAVSEGQPGNWEEPDFFLRMLETVRFQENGRQEPCESRGSRTDLWERGGEIPLRHPTLQLLSQGKVVIPCLVLFSTNLISKQILCPLYRNEFAKRNMPWQVI